MLLAVLDALFAREVRQPKLGSSVALPNWRTPVGVQRVARQAADLPPQPSGRREVIDAGTEEEPAVGCVARLIIRGRKGIGAARGGEPRQLGRGQMLPYGTGCGNGPRNYSV
jgi:hypothetical protein